MLKEIYTNKVLLLFLFAGLITRLALATLPGFKFDVDAWFAWAVRLNEMGFAQFYSSQVWTNYTPGIFYILYPLGFFKQAIGIPDSVFYYILKLPAIVAEIILGIIIYHFAKKYTSKKNAVILSGLVLLNPAFILNSAVWGQIDGLLSLCMFLAIVFLVEKKLLYSSIWLGLSLLIKPQAIALLPIYILYLLKHFSLRNVLQLFLPAAILTLLLSFPFFPTQPFTGLFNLIKQMSQDYHVTSLFAFNFWAIVGFWIEDNTKWLRLTYQLWGIVALCLTWIIISVRYLISNINLYFLGSLATLSFYFLPTRVHERYLLPALVFLIFSLLFVKKKIFGVLVILITFIHFLNLYYVYIFYNHFFLKVSSALYNPFIYNFLDTKPKLISVVASFCFVMLSYLLLTHKDEPNKT